MRPVVVVIDGDDLAVQTLDAAGVSDFPADGVVAQCDGAVPRLSVVAAQEGADAVRLGAIAVGDAQATIAEPQQHGRIATESTGFSHYALQFPTCAVVAGAIRVDAILVSV